jgi:hypothetical protein
MVDKLIGQLLELTTLYAERAFWLSGVGAPYRVLSAARHSAGFSPGKGKTDSPLRIDGPRRAGGYLALIT